ncbi:unnamed protein product, partial [Meganyctiphanes norvegica]
MGSRLRDNPSQLFVCWCEVVGPQGDQPPWIIQKFPSNYKNEEILKSVPQFTFPCNFDNSTVQHFSFVLTSLDSKWTYGFCRHAPGNHTALVLLSYLPWHETFYRLLNHLSELMTTNRTGDLWACLQSLYQAAVPKPGSEVTIPYADNKFFVARCTNHLKLPTIPDNRNLSEYYNAVDSNNMMIIFASMLFERRIIVTSKRLSRLSACVQAANSVIYPMQWQHIFIPVLPEHLVDYLLAPMPFLIGVSSNLITKVNSEDIGDAVVLDADNNQVRTPFDDLDALPEDVVHSLKRNLKNPNTMLGDSVARAFLRALVQLIGNYREALQFREEDRLITFNRDKFISSRPSDFQPFVEKMLDLQIFQQFIEDRLDQLNRGRQTSDEFELEVSVHCEKSSSKVKTHFKNVVTNVRKESGAIMKTVKTKTNMAGKSAAKSVSRGSKQVKERGRQTYKDFRGKLKENNSPHDNATWINAGSPPKPRSAPSSPTLPVKMRPKTMVDNAGYSAKVSYKRASQSHLREEANHGPRKYELIEQGTGLGSPPTSDTFSTPSPQSLDLLEDMQEVLSRLSGPTSESTKSRTSTGSSSSSNSSSNSACSSGANSPNSTATQIKLHNKPDSLSTASDMSSNKIKKLNVVHPFLTAHAKNAIWRYRGKIKDLQLSASLTSLPLIDFSLDIQLPPPITNTLCHFPNNSDVDGSGGCGDGGGDIETASPPSIYRSPKLIHYDISKTSSSTTPTNKSVDTSIISSASTTTTSATSSSPTTTRPTWSSGAAAAAAAADSPRCSDTWLNSSQPSSDTAVCTGRKHRSANTTTRSNTTGTVDLNTSFKPSKSYKSTYKILKPGSSLPSSASSSPYSYTTLPRYGASRAFSASLSKYSKPGPRGGYFYSALSSKSIDDDDHSPSKHFEAIESSMESVCSFVHLPSSSASSRVTSPVNIVEYAPLPRSYSPYSPPHHRLTHSYDTANLTSTLGSSSNPRYAGNLLFYDSSDMDDIMSTSLPADITMFAPDHSVHVSPSQTPPQPPPRTTSVLPPPPPSLGRRTRSPSPSHRASVEGLTGPEDGSEADLIYLQSPSDEIFDPLIAKSIPRGVGGGPPVPTRPSQPPPPIPTSGSAASQKKSTSTSFLHHGGGIRSWHSYLHHHRSVNTTGLPTTPAAPPILLAHTNAQSRPTSTPSPNSRASTSPSPGELRPFSTLQSSMGTPIGCQNPMYTQHILPSVANQLSSGTRGGSAAAAFASSLITQNSEDKSSTSHASTGGSVLRPGQYVQFEPPLLAKKESLVNQSLSPSVSQPMPPLRSHKDLLGDYSSEFQKLSVNSGSGAGNQSVKSSTLPSNNNTSSFNNNVHALTKNTDSKANLNHKNWATFN